MLEKMPGSKAAESGNTDRSRWQERGSCLEEIQGVAAPAHGGLPPLVGPQPDLGQQGIALDWVPSKPAGPQIQGCLILYEQWTPL